MLDTVSLLLTIIGAAALWCITLLFRPREHM